MDILDACLNRSNKIGAFECPNLEELKYWEVRFTLPFLVSISVLELANYFVDNYNAKKYTNKEAFSFYYYILDELRRIAELESNHLTFRGESSVIHSTRARQHPQLMELYQLANGCPIKADKIKNMKYGDVFDALLYISIDSEKKYKKPRK